MPKPSRKGISARKRLRQSVAARDRNRSVKSRTRTVITRALVAVGNDAGSAEDAVREAISALDRAAKKGVIHANAAARSKSRLMKRFNQGVANSVAAAAASAPLAESEAPATEAAGRRRAPAARKTDAAKPAARRTTAKDGDDKPKATRGRGAKS